MHHQIFYLHKNKCVIFKEQLGLRLCGSAATACLCRDLTAFLSTNRALSLLADVTITQQLTAL